LLEEPEEESGLELLLPLLLLPGDELLPEELPCDELPEELVPSEPPMPELGLTPKYENTLCFQPGCDKSVEASKDGADCSLLVSPLNVNVCCPWLDELELVDELELLELEGRSKVQGTATSLPEEELLEPMELLLLPGDELPPLLLLEGDELLLLDGDELLLLPSEELLPLLLLEGDELAPDEPDELLSERIAQSIFPEVGLTMISLIVPRVSPDVDWTLAPVNWLPFMA